MPLRYRLLIENKTSKRQRGLSLLEDLADPHISSAVESGPVLFEWGFLRIIRNSRKPKRLAKTRRHLIPPLAPFASGTAEATILPCRRGMLRFEGVTIARPDPLGYSVLLFD